MTRIRTPIRQRGVKTERWGAWQQRCRAAVTARAHGRCESCGARGVALEWAHIASRALFAEPWASLPELTMALCVECHHAIDRNLKPALKDFLRVLVKDRLAKAFPSLIVRSTSDPLGDLRFMVGQLEEQFEFDPENHRIVRKDRYGA